MHYAHLEIGWDFESPKFARFHRVGCVLLGDRLIDVFMIGYEKICFSGRLDIERCASFHPTIIITNIIPKTNNPSIPITYQPYIIYNTISRKDILVLILQNMDDRLRDLTVLEHRFVSRLLVDHVDRSQQLVLIEL